VTCSTCHKLATTKPTKAGEERLPKGWKRRGDETICGECWSKAFILRAITFPVASPVGLDWSAFRLLLATCWQQSTGLANWATTELAKADVIRDGSSVRMPAMPRLYLYPAARARFPAMTPSSVVSLLHAVEGRYRKARLEVIWRAAASLPRYRYPVPYPVNAQNWSVRWLSETERVPIMELRLGDQRIALRLQGGHGLRRQLAGFAHLVDGTGIGCEAALYRQRASSSDHRIGIDDRGPGGREKIHYRVMVKLVAWLPRVTPDQATATLDVRTSKDAFLVAEIDGRDPWTLNADHVLRWITAHRRRLDRLSEDTKREKRWPQSARANIADYRERFVAAHHRRLDTWTHQASAMLVAYAQRQKVARLRYDDSERITSEFPWHQLAEKIRYKCDGAGITFAEVASGEVPEKKPEALADSESSLQ
jgi:hypothetical protein